MIATNVYNALNAAISNSSIDLWTTANGSPDLTGLIQVMNSFGIKSNYLLSNVVLTLTPSGSGVRLTGNGFFTSKISYPVNATLQYSQDGDIFSLALALQTDWGFTDFFGPLPQTFMEVPDRRPGITWYDSILKDMKVRSAVFTGTSGSVDLQLLTGLLLLPNAQQHDKKHLLDKTSIIGPWPLRLSGTVTMPDDTRLYPLMDLYARGLDSAIEIKKEENIEGLSDLKPIEFTGLGLNFIIAPLIPPQPDIIAFSTVRLYGDFVLSEIEGRISTLILSTNALWNFVVQFRKESASLVQGINQLTTFFGVAPPVPMNFPVLSDFYVAEVDIDIENTGTDQSPSFTLNALGLTIRSNKTWQPPVPFVTINNVGTRWVWTWTEVLKENGDFEKISLVTGSVFGTMNFGSGGTSLVSLPSSPYEPNGDMPILVVNDQPVSLHVGMSIPQFIITGSLAEGSYIPIGEVLKYFFKSERLAIPKMCVSRLSFSADPFGQNYFANATILFIDPVEPVEQQGWEINLGITTILVSQLEFDIAYNNGRLSGGISGVFYLVQGDPSDYTLPRFLLSAASPVQDTDTPQGWTLKGRLYEGTSIKLTDLVYRFINGEKAPPPYWVPDIDVDRLFAVFHTSDHSYMFGATISARWEPAIFDKQLKINASASIDLEKQATSENATGKITGTFSVNRIMLTASLTLGGPEPTYLFKVQFDNLWLQATTSWRGESDARHQVVTLQLGGVTLGDMLEYLVNLAAPTLGFRLDSPWDVLKKIDLSRFVLTIDPKENIVEFIFNTNVDLVVAQLDAIGVRYSRQSGQGKVDLILTGNFLGQRYTEDDPLSWDVINDPPPSVPGQGTSLVNLRYLGLGQRVTFNGDTPTTVAESIARLRADMTPPPSEGYPMPATMSYSAESQWLIGLDVTLMNTVDLGFIFNDPKLYGLSIALGGERAGGLAGLKFEILYRKITDEIGMFRIAFQVPDQFRTIQLGVVSLTLGIIVVEIYTNGNFKIDLGFPYERDFARSFSLQAYIFIGRGGFYFGLLNGDTSTQVPRISNGNFAPVIELGIGIAAGVGREIRAGILSGGAYVELQVIFQGVLAWFNPDSNGAAPVPYFKCQGIAALHGKIYGSVDFKVLKVSVTLDAYAQISLVYESYQPLIITLKARVSAEASVKVLFVKVYFSFSDEIEVQFVVGSAQPTPWILSNNSDSSKSLSAAQGRRVPFTYRSKQHFYLKTNQHRRLKALHKTHQTALKRLGILRREAAIEDNDYLLNWNPGNKVFADSPRKAHLTLLPVFTVADVPVSWDGSTPANSNPDYRSAFVLFADTGMSPAATTAAECRLRDARHSGMTANDTSLLAADILTQGLLLYAINALPRDPAQGNTITAGQMEQLLKQLEMPETMESGLSVANLVTFFSTNIHLWISGDTDPRPDEKSAMVLPLPPFLSWTSVQGGDVDFSSKNKIGPWYEWGISQLLNAFLPVGPGTGPPPKADDPLQYESFTSFLFRDFCLMLIQNSIKEMQKHLDKATVTVQEKAPGVGQSLEQVAAALPTAVVAYTISSGDTVESVAEHLGATADELLFLNPTLPSKLIDRAIGTSINILLGIAPEILALDNADTPFAVNQCNLGTLVHQALTNETLKSIATLFQVSSVADLLRYCEPVFPYLSSGNNILREGASFSLPQRTFSYTPADFGQLRTAAVFFVRYTNLTTLENTPLPEMANWYAQAIAEMNQPLLQTLAGNQLIPITVELLPGYSLLVPNSYLSTYKDLAKSNQYTTVAGDTLERIGFAMALQQDYGTNAPPGVSQWPVFLSGVTAAGNQSWNIPAQSGILVEAGSTIELLVRRLIIEASWANPDQPMLPTGTWIYNWDSVAAWIGPADVLAPIASITVPNASTEVFTDIPLSFNVLANTYGLPVTDAAGRLKGVDNLFATGTKLVVKHLPAQDIDLLVTSILQDDSFVSIVNQSSRMLMSGLRLPGLLVMDGHVVTAPDTSLPLYDLTGQQFSVPVDSTQLTQIALSLSLSSGQPWIVLFDSIAVQAGQTLQQLEQEYPGLPTYNPGLSPDTFAAGMLLLTAPVTATLDYYYTNEAVLSAAPATGLSIVPVPPVPPAPAAMKIKGTVPRTYGLEHRIELQSPVMLPIPQIPGQQNVTGNPGLWMLPPELVAKALAGVAAKYEILATPAGTPAGSAALQIDNSTFSTLISFRIKRLDENGLQFNLIGVDAGQRNILLLLSNWLQAQPADDKTAAYLLLSPAPDAANTAGLTILTTDPTEAFLVKTNLSTISVPPSLLAARALPSAPGYFATMFSLADFLLLLWEGSTVGGTGYYFSPGVALPAGAFDQQGNIVLQLLVIAGTQQAIPSDGRSLLPFNNCALTGPGTDSAQLSVFIQSNGSTDPSETIVQALVPPGNVGFELLMANPETLTDSLDSKEVLLNSMYSLLTFSIEQTSESPFVSSPSGVPVMPKPSDGIQQEPWQKARALRKGKAAGLTPRSELPKPYWYYSQVIPVSRFIVPGTPLAAPDVSGLPPAANDPYQGFGTRSTMPAANFVFGFGDVLGNRTGANSGGQGTTPIEVGYTDIMVGIGDWPSVVRYFTVQKINDEEQLTAVIAPRPSELLPAPFRHGDANREQIFQQQQKFAQSYYQLIQPGVTAWLVSSLNFIRDSIHGNKKVQIDTGPLWRFAAASYAFTGSLGLLQAAKPTGCSTLGNIITTYGIRYTELAAANAETSITGLFGNTLPAVPAYYPFVEYLSITGLAALPPQGWPAPTPTALLTLQQNSSLPLKTGTTLTIPAKTISVGGIVPTPSIQTLATENYTRVSDIATQNYEQPVLQTGFEFAVAVDDDTEIVITVDADNNSFQKVVELFAGSGVNISVEALANMYKDSSGVFALNTTFSIGTYVARENDTLSMNSSGISPAELAANNLNTKDLFEPGTLIYFGEFTGITEADTTVTLRQFAEQYACPPELLLSYNPGFILPASGSIVLPGTLSWPSDTSTFRIPYTISASDTLDSIGPRFNFDSTLGEAALQLAALNINMPGTLQPDINLNIPVSGVNYSVGTGVNPSFAAVLRSLQLQAPSATLEDIVSAIGNEPDTLSPGGLLMSQVVLFTGPATPLSISGLYNVSAASFALANTAVQNLIAPAVELKAPTGTQKIITSNNDTFNSLIIRFAEQDVSVSADEIVNANLDALLFKAGAMALLPPAPVNFSTNVSQDGPYNTPFAPLQLSIRLLRPASLIYSGFETLDGKGPVEMAESDFPVPVSNQDQKGSLTYTQFIEDLVNALPKLRLGTGQADSGMHDLWQVEFNDSGIRSVELSGAITVNEKAQPRFFALKPLYKHLITRTTPVATLNEDGTLGTVQDTSFQSIDVELWAQKFLEDIDRFLAGANAMAVYNNPDVQQYLKTVMDAKALLIPVIAAGLDMVLNVSDPDKTPALESAVDTVKQQLGVSLSNAYEATVIIQYDSAVHSVWQDNPNLKLANLYGQGCIVASDGLGKVPGLTIRAAKTDLSKANSYVNFLMTLDNPAFHKEVKGAFQYQISNLEFNISDDNVPQPYKASEWLTFVPLLAGATKPLALQGTDPGEIDVPIPLRNFPELPKIIAQQAVQGCSDVQTIGCLSHWNYEFTYTHQHTSQDYVIIRAEFNLQANNLQKRSLIQPRDLFTELAQYISVAAPLWSLLNALTGAQSPSDPGKIVNAVSTFASLAMNVADYWTTRLAQADFYRSAKDLMVAESGYSFLARVGYRDSKDLDYITLTIIDSEPGPNRTWPDVYVQQSSTGEFIQLLMSAPVQGTATYQVPAGKSIPPVAWPVFKIVWTDLNLATVQNARSQMSVQRNQALLDNVPTNPAFIFTTNTVTAPATITPLNSFSKRISINYLGDTFTNALKACFSALFGEHMAGQRITFELRYGFGLVAPSKEGDTGLITLLPVCLYADQALTDDTADAINGIMQAWKDDNSPVEQGGEWNISMKLYSGLTSNTQVLLYIDHIVFYLFQ